MNNWKADLHDFLQPQMEKQKRQIELEQKKTEQKNRQNKEIEKFHRTIVIPAFREFKHELEKYQRVISILRAENREDQYVMTLFVSFYGKEELDFRIDVDIAPTGSMYPYYKSVFLINNEIKGHDQMHYFKIDHFKIDQQKKQLAEVSKDDILQVLLHEYKGATRYSAHGK